LLEIIPPTLKNLAVHLRICTRKAGPTLDKVNFSDLDHFLTKSCSSSALVHSEYKMSFCNTVDDGVGSQAHFKN